MDVKEDVNSLIHALKAEKWDVRRKAAWALGTMGKSAVEPLILALRDDDSSVRRQAARSLALLSEEPVKTAIHDYESTLEERDRDAFQNCKKLYMQERARI